MTTAAIDHRALAPATSTATATATALSLALAFAAPAASLADPADGYEEAALGYDAPLPGGDARGEAGGDAGGDLGGDVGEGAEKAEDASDPDPSEDIATADGGAAASEDEGCPGADARLTVQVDPDAAPVEKPGQITVSAYLAGGSKRYGFGKLRGGWERSFPLCDGLSYRIVGRAAVGDKVSESPVTMTGATTVTLNGWN
ncbi:MAG: hypothetical protein AAF416_08265 [Pseudomonadota bacterium]